MIKFVKYHSIENTSRKKIIDYIISENLDKGEFVVQEKTHGANLSFWFDGDEFKSAKRSGFIKDDFYDFETVEKKYRIKVIELYNYLKNKDYDFNQLAVYGELIGGLYPHDDVEKVKNSTRIQKGIYYTPENDFYAFDLAIDSKLFDIDSFVQIMEETGFLYAKTLFRGTFQECMEYPNKFQTTIPVSLGLPEIKDNFCEGVVIKPVKPVFLTNRDRLILKNKNEKWAEKGKPKNKQKPVYSKQTLKISADIENYVNENRLRNVLSKIGKVGLKEFGKIMKEFSQDAMNDFLKDHGEEFQQLDKKEQKVVSKTLNNACSNLIRPDFQNIVDGTY